MIICMQANLVTAITENGNNNNSMHLVFNGFNEHLESISKSDKIFAYIPEKVAYALLSLPEHLKAQNIFGSDTHDSLYFDQENLINVCKQIVENSKSNSLQIIEYTSVYKALETALYFLQHPQCIKDNENNPIYQKLLKKFSNYQLHLQTGDAIITIVPEKTINRRPSRHKMFCKLTIKDCLRATNIVAGDVTINGTLTVDGKRVNGCICAQGQTGPTGPQGLIGNSGPTGFTGDPGQVGSTGATGNTGPTGNAGSAGFTGATGNTGATGAAGTPGTTGPTGPIGIAGMIGATGPSGAIGSTGPIGNTGSAGPIGATGATGNIGPSGAAGTPGTTGPTGPTGLAGMIGATGPSGTIGLTGNTGHTGPTGMQGLGLPLFATSITCGMQIATGSTFLNNTSFIAAQSGIYLINFNASSEFDGSRNATFDIYLNGTPISGFTAQASAMTTNATDLFIFPIAISMIIPLNAGDTVQVHVMIVSGDPGDSITVQNTILNAIKIG